MGRWNLPSRTSSANSRSFDASARAKTLYYLRGRRGKSARIAERKDSADTGSTEA